MKRRTVLAGGAALGLAGCGGGSKFRSYTGPQVTRIQVFKDDRRMFLLNGSDVLKEYKIRLGFTARGPKQFEGDGKTPEGAYLIDRKEPAPNLILLDINMPKLDGFEFLDAASKALGADFAVVVVMLTTSLNPADRDRAKQYAAIKEYLNKPLTVDLLAQISALLNPA